MLKTVKKTLSDKIVLPQDSRILAGVSGGVDSVVMLHILNELSLEFGFSLQVVHVNHNMRGEEARKDAELVKRFCEFLDLPFHLREIPADEWEDKSNKQERARSLRRILLEKAAGELECSFIATAHHANDQAETFIDRLLRGSGPRGLAAMNYVNGKYIRPLLGVSRQQIVEYAKKNDILWREDMSNADPAYKRSRIRYQLMPLLLKQNPKAVEAICRASEIMRSQVETLDQIACKELDARFKRLDDVRFGLSFDNWQDMPKALRVSLLQGFVEKVRGNLRGYIREHWENMDSLSLEKSSNSQVWLPNDWVGYVDEGYLVISSVPPQDVPEFEFAVENEGSYHTPAGNVQVEFIPIEKAKITENEESAVFDVDKLTEGLILRNRRPGDIIEMEALGHRKVSKVMMDHSIEPRKRPKLPLLVCGDEILWIAGVKRSAVAMLGDNTKNVLHVWFNGHSF